MVQSPSSKDTRDSDFVLPLDFGRYRIKSILGRGAMGTVYLAQDTELNRPVALKMPKFVDGPPLNLIERFRREARSAAVLSHPNICPVYDVGQCDGRHFICMGYVEGRPLSDYIAAGTRWSEQDAASTIRKLAIALQEAHDRGLVHRDLKPANIIINQRNEPIIMDFGLSRHVDDGAARLTEDGTIVGTPAYMAPEQLGQNNAVGLAVDVYSLGVVLYELLCGKTPFSGSVMAVLSQIMHADPAPIAKYRPDISPEMSAVCRRAMEKDPQRRFRSMAEFAAALSAILKRDPSSQNAEAETTTTIPRAASLTRQVELPTQAIAETIVTNSLPRPEATASRSPSRKVLLLLLIPISLVVIAGVAFLARGLFPPGQPPSGDASATADGPPGLRPNGPAIAPPTAKSPEEQFARMDKNANQMLDPDELALHIIHRADTDGDDQLTRDEYLQAWQERGEKLFARPEREGYGPRLQRPADN